MYLLPVLFLYASILHEKVLETSAFQVQVTSGARRASPDERGSFHSAKIPLLDGRQSCLLLSKKDYSQDDADSDMNPLTKASWYAVELFGNVFGSDSATKTTAEIDLSEPPQSLSETLERIQLDNDRSYFLSGEVDRELYAPSCIFRDPFVSFEGRDRFITNLANLGSFITKYDAKVLKYEQPDDTTIETKIMVKLELNLPWKPVLAWPWGVTYTVDPSTFLVVDHEESWDIEPLEGVKQIFRKPTVTI